MPFYFWAFLQCYCDIQCALVWNLTNLNRIYSSSRMRFFLFCSCNKQAHMHFSEVVFLLDAQTSWVLTSSGLFFIDLPWIWRLGQAQWGCVIYYQVPQCNFNVKHYVYFVLPTCLDHARGAQHMASGLYDKPVGYAIIMDLSRNVHMNSLY